MSMQRGSMRGFKDKAKAAGKSGLDLAKSAPADPESKGYLAKLGKLAPKMRRATPAASK